MISITFLHERAMDLKQLKAFLTVAETGNVTRASALLNLVQPAVSRQVRLLEEDIGTNLFDRSRQGMELTEAGRKLVEYARRVLLEVERARAELQASQGNVAGIATIGLLPSTCDLVSSALVAAVARTYPEIRVRISMGYTGTMQQWLETGEVDAGLLYDPRESTVMQFSPLLEEPLWVVGLPSAGLSLGQPMAMADLVGNPLVLPSAPHGIRTLVDGASTLMHLKLNVAAETNSMSVQKSLVLGGHGLTILPAIAVAEDVARGALAAAPLANPSLMRKIVLAIPTNRHTTAPVNCVLGLLQRIMKDAVESGAWPSARWLGPASS